MKKSVVFSLILFAPLLTAAGITLGSLVFRGSLESYMIITLVCAGVFSMSLLVRPIAIKRNSLMKKKIILWLFASSLAYIPAYWLALNLGGMSMAYADGGLGTLGLLGQAAVFAIILSLPAQLIIIPWLSIALFLLHRVDPEFFAIKDCEAHESER